MPTTTVLCNSGFSNRFKQNIFNELRIAVILNNNEYHNCIKLKNVMRNIFTMKVIVILLVLFSFSCNSQQPASKMDKIAAPIIEAFFAKVASGESDNAIATLLSGNPNIDQNDSSVIDLRNKFDIISNAVGEFRGKSLIKKRSLNEEVSVYSYLAKYEKKFYRFWFMFYNNGSKITIYKFRFDDDLDAELEESLKLYTN